jgi:2-oxo-4-hydroxy-4-carboxy-5-ureidoimidazoline decarboxylase
MTLEELNARDHRGFVVALGGVFEDSPWVAEAAWPRHPFATLDALYRAMVDAVRSAGEDAQLALIRAHPELAGKAAVRGELTADSTAEQSGAGLTQCSPREFARLQELNAAYNAKFGFPFIIAVKGLDRAAIIERFAERLERDRATEFEEALQQIARIAWLRLEALVEE